MKSKSKVLLEKSKSSALAAIEIYNKPDFSYREETFCILMFNAWELLVKARLVQQDGNRLDALWERETILKKDGTPSKKNKIKTGRSNNKITKGLFNVVKTLQNEFSDLLPGTIRDNLDALSDIRNSSVHFFNQDYGLSKKIHGIASASLHNYTLLIQEWFGVSLSSYNFYILPVAFIQNVNEKKSVVLNTEERKLLSYLDSLDVSKDKPMDGKGYKVSLEIEVNLKRSSLSPHEVRITNNPNAVAIRYSDEDIANNWPWKYDTLTKRLSLRYMDFKANEEYHKIRRPLEKDSKYCYERFLDPENKKSSKTKRYSQAILNEFDKHYTLSKKL